MSTCSKTLEWQNKVLEKFNCIHQNILSHYVTLFICKLNKCKLCKTTSSRNWHLLEMGIQNWSLLEHDYLKCFVISDTSIDLKVSLCFYHWAFKWLDHCVQIIYTLKSGIFCRPWITTAEKKPHKTKHHN